MARKKGMGTLALVGGGIAAAWWLLRKRPIDWAQKLSELDTMAGKPVEGAEYYLHQQETARLAAIVEAKAGAGDISAVLATMTPEQWAARYPATSMTPLQLERIKRRYPDATILSNAQIKVLKEKGIVPDRYNIVASSPSIQEIDAGAVIIVVPEQMVPVVAAALQGYGALYAEHGGSGVTGLGY